MKPMKPILALLAATLILGAVPATAATALESLMEVEQTLLAEDMEQLRNLTTDRTQVELQIRTLNRTLTTILGSVRDEDLVQAELIFRQIEDIEANRRMLFSAQQALVARILDRKRKLELLSEQSGAGGVSALQEQGPLSGSWRVVMMPREQVGAFNLVQTGTLVSGTYTLAGGWSGSLQGTLVNRKVYLVRIDSRLGRSMEFEGTLSADGTTIRGSWLNYDLGGQEGAQGQWSATRAEPEE